MIYHVREGVGYVPRAPKSQKTSEMNELEQVKFPLLEPAPQGMVSAAGTFPMTAEHNPE